MTAQTETIRPTGLIHDGCGGQIVEVRQTETVEAGGHVMTYIWSEEHCERCGADMWDLIERSH